MPVTNFFKKLLFSRQFVYNRGRFYLMMNVPGLILPMHAFVSFVKQYVDDSGKQAKNHLFEVGRLQGLGAGKRYANIASGSFPKLSDSLKDVAETMGLGRVKYIKKKGDIVSGSFDPSVFAEVHKEMYGKSEIPVCDYLCGVAAGVFEPFLSYKLKCQETRCKAKGDPDCHFILTKIEGDKK